MSDIPADFKYTDDDEWVRVEGNRATIGITDFAQGEMTDIVFVLLPNEGDEVKIGEPFMELESVKATSEVYAPLSGTITKVNLELEAGPEVVNQDPYGKGWLVEIELSDPDQLAQLMSAEQYQAHLDAKK